MIIHNSKHTQSREPQRSTGHEKTIHPHQTLMPCTSCFTLQLSQVTESTYLIT